jgi:long-chain acyl-CoA synthetase
MSANFGDLPRSWNDGPAVADMGDDERVIDYSHFNADCAALARGLLRMGLKKGDRIAILGLNRYEYLVALFGAPRAGLVPVPVNIKIPHETVAYILADSGAKLAFVDTGSEALRPPSLKAVRFDDTAAWQGILDPGAFESAEPGNDDPALQIYTSGSTGRPKGVLLGHEGQVWNAQVLSRSRQLARNSTMLIAAPLYHKNALIAAKIAATAGGKAVLLPRFDPRHYIEAIGRHKVTSLSGVSTMYQLILAETELLKRTDLTSVKAISVGSGPASPALLEGLRKAFPGASVVGNYGLTEGGPVPFGIHPEGKPRPNGSIGYPLQGSECRLVGSADEGVLHVRNPGVLIGYHNLPDETSKRLKDGWFDTQDILRRDSEGFYYFVGRADDMFKCGGESVFPTEVESLLERHADVLQAAVVPVADTLKDQIPIAFVVLRPGATVDEAALKRFTLENGPAHQHPRRVIVLPELPLAGTNKIDIKALKERAKEFARSPA